MKPFDLEAAKRGEPIMFRDGTPATFGSVSPDGTYCMVWFRGNQLYTIKTGNSDFCDIVMAPRKVVKYAPVFWLNGEPVMFATKGQGAQRHVEFFDEQECASGITMARIEWEE